MKFYEYPKIPTACKRDEGGSKKLTDQLASDTLNHLSGTLWEGTEKIDGTNCGIIWDGHRVKFQGRTADAAFSARHFNYLQDTFQTDAVEQLFEQMFGDRPVVLFGELVGGGVQDNLYTDEPLFIAFDLLMTAHGEAPEVWANRIYFNQVVEALNIAYAPVVFHGSLQQAIDFVKGELHVSSAKTCVMEGLVLRPVIELRDNQGKRIACKVKAKDYFDKGEIKEFNKQIKGGVVCTAKLDGKVFSKVRIKPDGTKENLDVEE